MENRSEKKISEAAGTPDDVPVCFHAPLRISPLGAHVDHQGGTVTGMSINRGVTITGKFLDDPLLLLQSTEFPGKLRLALNGKRAKPEGRWEDYPRAATWVLCRSFPLRRGFEGNLSGDLPGMGLSSSAAVLICIIRVLAAANGIELEKNQLARMVQDAENNYLGLSSGLLDPSIILHARKNALTLIDCRSLTVRNVDFPHQSPPLQILIAFSGVHRRLAGTDYNQRVSQCTRAAAGLLGTRGKKNPRLCDVSKEIFRRKSTDLNPLLQRRAKHYFSEINRVERACEAWENGDLELFGQLISLSGLSSIENYECGIPETIFLYELLKNSPQVYGTRFSGGGFGGSCIALLRPDTPPSLLDELSSAYAAAFPALATSSQFILCESSGPARFLRGGPA